MRSILLVLIARFLTILVLLRFNPLKCACAKKIDGHGIVSTKPQPYQETETLQENGLIWAKGPAFRCDFEQEPLIDSSDSACGTPTAPLKAVRKNLGNITVTSSGVRNVDPDSPAVQFPELRFRWERASHDSLQGRDLINIAGAGDTFLHVLAEDERTGMAAFATPYVVIEQIQRTGQLCVQFMYFTHFGNRKTTLGNTFYILWQTLSPTYINETLLFHRQVNSTHSWYQHNRTFGYGSDGSSESVSARLVFLAIKNTTETLFIGLDHISISNGACMLEGHRDTGIGMATTTTTATTTTATTANSLPPPNDTAGPEQREMSKNSTLVGLLAIVIAVAYLFHCYCVIHVVCVYVWNTWFRQGRNEAVPYTSTARDETPNDKDVM